MEEGRKKGARSEHNSLWGFARRSFRRDNGDSSGKQGFYDSRRHGGVF